MLYYYIIYKFTKTYKLSLYVLDKAVIYKTESTDKDIFISKMYQKRDYITKLSISFEVDLGLCT